VLAPLADDYDLAVLDCAPSISLVSESVFAAADLLLVPLVPSTLSERTLDQLHDFLDGPRPRVLPFFSMVDKRKRLHRDVMARTPGVARSPIPSASVVELMGARRLPVVVSHPKSPPALAYRALWDEVAAAVGV
jgi:cellulose biosynthesis protein BcsQ